MYSLIFYKTMIRLTENPLTNPAAWQCVRSVFVCYKHQSACRICREHFFNNHTKKPITPPPQIMNVLDKIIFFEGANSRLHCTSSQGERRGKGDINFLLSLPCSSLCVLLLRRRARRGTKGAWLGYFLLQIWLAGLVRPQLRWAWKKKKNKKAWRPTWWEIVDTLFYFIATDARFILLKRGGCQRISAMRSIINEPKAALARWLRQMGTLSGR